MALDSKQKRWLEAGARGDPCHGRGFASLSMPSNALPADEPGARIVWALQWALLPMLALMVMVMRWRTSAFSRLKISTAAALPLAAENQRPPRRAPELPWNNRCWRSWRTLSPLSRSPMIGCASSLRQRCYSQSGASCSPWDERGAGGRAAGFGLTRIRLLLLITTATLLALHLMSWVAG